MNLNERRVLFLLKSILNSRVDVCDCQVNFELIFGQFFCLGWKENYCLVSCLSMHQVHQLTILRSICLHFCGGFSWYLLECDFFYHFYNYKMEGQSEDLTIGQKLSKLAQPYFTMDFNPQISTLSITDQIQLPLIQTQQRPNSNCV